MTPPRLIGLAGFKGTGKTTIANILGEYNYALFKFAKPLKDMLRALGLTEAEIEGSLKELPSSLFCNRSPRYLMQTLGTEWGRNLIGADLWVNLWEQQVKKVLQASIDNCVVVDDCRFPNEFEKVWKLGGEIWLINRPNTSSEDGHSSESFINFCNPKVIISNNSTIEELREEINLLVKYVD